MTILKIIPNFEDKTAECIGYPSAGEHVDVRIVGAANLLPSSTLRFRVKFGHVTIAVFPRSDVNEVWETEGADLKCHLNLNTVQARSVCRTGNTVCHAILDQVGDDEHTVEPTLFFDDLFDMTPWYREPGVDEPYDLGLYPNQVADLNVRVNEIVRKIGEAKNAAETASGSAHAAYEAAQSAVEAAQSANGRANAAESAARSSSANALSARNDARRSEEFASSAAGSAAEAEKSAEDALEAARSKADLVDGKIPASQLPSYVDDVLEFVSRDLFPSVGESGKIYIAKDTNKQYRWSGSQYVELGGGGIGEDVNAVHYYAETKTEEEKALARANIGAMSADSPIPQVAGKLQMKPLPKYLHELSFDDTYMDDARAWYAAHDHDTTAPACSAVRKGGLLGRNYDWTYDEAAEFVVKVSASKGRHASVGVANVRTDLTEDMVCSGSYSPLYRVLPGRVVDGINDAGVVAEVNVIPRDETKDPAQSETRNLHAFEVVRHVLDNYASAAEAAAYVAAHYYIPDGDFSYHWMIADVNGTYIVEDGAVIGNKTTMTNYRVGVADDPYGNGYARRAILGGTGTVSELLEAAKFTNAYANGWPWPDEFAAVGVGTHDQESVLKAWATSNVTPLLDPDTRKPATRGNGCWHTVHSSIYDLGKHTLSIAVQEDFSRRFVFAADDDDLERAKDYAFSVANRMRSDVRNKTDLAVYLPGDFDFVGAIADIVPNAFSDNLYDSEYVDEYGRSHDVPNVGFFGANGRAIDESMWFVVEDSEKTSFDHFSFDGVDILENLPAYEINRFLDGKSIVRMLMRRYDGRANIIVNVGRAAIRSGDTLAVKTVETIGGEKLEHLTVGGVGERDYGKVTIRGTGVQGSGNGELIIKGASGGGRIDVKSGIYGGGTIFLRGTYGGEGGSLLVEDGTGVGSSKGKIEMGGDTKLTITHTGDEDETLTDRIRRDAEVYTTEVDVWANDVAVPAGDFSDFSATVQDALVDVYGDAVRDFHFDQPIPACREMRFAVGTLVEATDNDVEVAWGDGTTTRLKDVNWTSQTHVVEDDIKHLYLMSHTYAAAGKYHVVIRGKDYYTLRFGGTGVSESSANNLVCDALGPTTRIASFVKNFASMFRLSIRLFSVNADYCYPLRNASNCANMFVFAYNLNRVSGLSVPDGCNCTGMFNECRSLVTLDGFSLPHDPVSCAQTFHSCYRLADSVSSLLPDRFCVGSLDVTNMFAGCHSLTGPVPADVLWNDKSISWSGALTAFSDSFPFQFCIDNIPGSWGGGGSTIVFDASISDTLNLSWFVYAPGSDGAVIDFGDGTIINKTDTAEIKHKYANGGLKTIRISNDFDRFSFYGSASGFGYEIGLRSCSAIRSIDLSNASKFTTFPEGTRLTFVCNETYPCHLENLKLPPNITYTGVWTGITGLSSVEFSSSVTSVGYMVGTGATRAVFNSVSIPSVDSFYSYTWSIDYRFDEVYEFVFSNRTLGQVSALPDYANGFCRYPKEGMVIVCKDKSVVRRGNQWVEFDFDRQAGGHIVSVSGDARTNWSYVLTFADGSVRRCESGTYGNVVHVCAVPKLKDNVAEPAYTSGFSVNGTDLFAAPSGNFPFGDYGRTYHSDPKHVAGIVLSFPVLRDTEIVVSGE